MDRIRSADSGSESDEGIVVRLCIIHTPYCILIS
jgi:hypothetical protein